MRNPVGAFAILLACAFAASAGELERIFRWSNAVEDERGIEARYD